MEIGNGRQQLANLNASGEAYVRDKAEEHRTVVEEKDHVILKLNESNAQLDN
jgi:hypothetical protein